MFVTRFCLRKSRHCRVICFAVSGESAGERSWFLYPAFVCGCNALSTCQELLTVGSDNLANSGRELNTASPVHCEQFLSPFWLIIWDGGIFNLISEVDKMERVTRFVHDTFMKRDETCDT